MTPAELQQLLITRAPDVSGITAVAGCDENPYGLTAPLEGGGPCLVDHHRRQPRRASPAATRPGKPAVPPTEALRS